MKYYTCSKSYRKECADIKNSIVKSLEMLSARITEYQHNGVSFNQIFNDDHVKYDKHGGCFTFKYKTPQNHQMRILYFYYQTAEGDVLVLVDYYIKQKNNKKYISKFDAYNKADVSEFIAAAEPLAS